MKTAYVYNQFELEELVRKDLEAKNFPEGMYSYDWSATVKNGNRMCDLKVTLTKIGEIINE